MSTRSVRVISAPSIESPQTATRSGFYLPQLDVLRFFAFLMVFLCHDLSPESYVQHWNAHLSFALFILRDTGGFGLCLFFFLSSYLITTLLLMEKAKTGNVRIRSFYVRRMLRIWPLYFFYLAAIALIGLRLRTWHIEGPRLFAMFLLVGNWYALMRGMGNSAIAALWSISVEEQFYLIWPNVFRFLTVQRFAWFTGIIGVLSIASTFLLARVAQIPLQVWLNSAPQGIFFACGALFAIYGQRTRRPSGRIFWLGLIGGLALWICGDLAEKVMDGSHLSSTYTTLEYILVACGCYLIMEGFLHLRPDRIPKLLIYLGKISYGLYVFHGLANHLYPRFFASRLPFFEMLVAFPFTLACAAASYQYLEKPFLRLKERFEVVRSRAVDPAR